MSFFHASIVGHFDTSDMSPQRTAPLRPINLKRVEQLLTEFGEDVARCVSIEGGYVWCEWSAGPSLRIMEFAERLADQEGCVVLETPLWSGRYPTEAPCRHDAALEVWKKDRKRH
jgi:hypothetical protein